MSRSGQETAPVTALLAFAVVSAYILELDRGGDAVCAAWGFTPSRPSALTATTSLFLHDPGSLFHLGGNLAILIVFGSIVERSIGSLRFIALYTAAGLAGALLHVVVDPTSTIPLVGASGAICGLIAFSVSINRRLVGFAAAFTIINVWYALTGNGGTISFGTHIGGLFIGVACAFAQALLGKERFA